MFRNIHRSLLATTGIAALGLTMSATALSAETLEEVMKRRELTQQDLLSAAKTYTPTGKRDEFIVFSSGGQSGQIIVYGVPSMRILKYIAVFTPEPWQGYGYDEESKKVLAQGDIDQAARFLAVVQRGVELHAALYPEEERWTRRNLASLWIDLGIIAEAKVDIPEAILCYRRGLEWANKHPNNNIRRRLIANLKRLGVEVE